jgi:hypothetical protein
MKVGERGGGQKFMRALFFRLTTGSQQNKKVDFFSYFIFSLGAQTPLHPSFRLAVMKLHIIFFYFGSEWGRESSSREGRGGWQAVISAIGKPINMCRSSEGLASWGTTQLLGMFAAACTILFSLPPPNFYSFLLGDHRYIHGGLRGKPRGGLLPPSSLPVCNCILNYSIARY